MFYKAMKQEAQADYDGEVGLYEAAMSEAGRAAMALDEVRNESVSKVIPALEAWLERFSPHKSIFELEEVVSQLRDFSATHRPNAHNQMLLGHFSQTQSADGQAIIAVAGGGAVAAGGAVVGGGAGASGAGAASAALLAPVGLLVGGVLIAGGLLYAWRRTRVKAQLFVEETEQERQGLIARREALQRFIEEAHAMTAELRALNDRIAPLLKELSTVSHLYVQYWTYKQRQALTVLMEAMRELRERLDTHVQLHAI